MLVNPMKYKNAVMQKSGSKYRGWLDLILRLLSLMMLRMNWSDAFGIKPYSGEVFVLYNWSSCVVGAVIIFAVLALNCVDFPHVRHGGCYRGFRFVLNFVGHGIFWVPVIKDAVTHIKPFKHLTAEFWVAASVIAICFVLQQRMICRDQRYMRGAISEAGSQYRS